MKYRLDMVHHNPGERPFQSAFLDSDHLVALGYTGQVFAVSRDWMPQLIDIGKDAMQPLNSPPSDFRVGPAQSCGERLRPAMHRCGTGRREGLPRCRGCSLRGYRPMRSGRRQAPELRCS